MQYLPKGKKMRVSTSTFINRFSRLKNWPEIPFSFRDVFVLDNSEDLTNLNKGIYTAVNKPYSVASYSLSQTIEVFEVKQEISSIWNMRAFIVRPNDHSMSFLDLQSQLTTELYQLNSDHVLKSKHDRDTNDLRNIIWSTEFKGCYVFLTYNKNAVRRLHNYFPDLAKQHLTECETLWKDLPA